VRLLGLTPTHHRGPRKPMVITAKYPRKAQLMGLCDRAPRRMICLAVGHRTTLGDPQTHAP